MSDSVIWFIEELGRLVKGIGTALTTLADKLRAEKASK